MSAYDNQMAELFEPSHDKTNKMSCAHSEDSDQPEHSPSLIRTFAVCSKDSQGTKDRGQRRLWSDWADAQADLSPCWAFCWFCNVADHIVYYHVQLSLVIGWLLIFFWFQRVWFLKVVLRSKMLWELVLMPLVLLLSWIRKENHSQSALQVKILHFICNTGRVNIFICFHFEVLRPSQHH